MLILRFSLSVKAYEVLKFVMLSGELAQKSPLDLPPLSSPPSMPLGPRGAGLPAPPTAPPFSFRTLVKLMLLRISYSCPAKRKLSRSS